MTRLDMILAVQKAKSTYGNITISGDFGTVTIVGSDAEAFLKSIWNKKRIDTTK